MKIQHVKIGIMIKSSAQREIYTIKCLQKGLKETRKKEQNKLKASRKNEIIKIKAEVNTIEKRKIIIKSKQPKCCCVKRSIKHKLTCSETYKKERRHKLLILAMKEKISLQTLHIGK